MQCQVTTIVSAAHVFDSPRKCEWGTVTPLRSGLGSSKWRGSSFTVAVGVSLLNLCFIKPRSRSKPRRRGEGVQVKKRSKGDDLTPQMNHRSRMRGERIWANYWLGFGENDGALRNETNMKWVIGLLLLTTTPALFHAWTPLTALTSTSYYCHSPRTSAKLNHTSPTHPYTIDSMNKNKKKIKYVCLTCMQNMALAYILVLHIVWNWKAIRLGWISFWRKSLMFLFSPSSQSRTLSPHGVTRWRYPRFFWLVQSGSRLTCTYFVVLYSPLMPIRALWSIRNIWFPFFHIDHMFVMRRGTKLMTHVTWSQQPYV